MADCADYVYVIAKQTAPSPFHSLLLMARQVGKKDGNTTIS